VLNGSFIDILIIIPAYKNGDKADCGNYQGISLLPTTYKMSHNFLLSRLTAYVDKITGGHQCGFWCGRLTTIICSEFTKFLR
jgi:hypothetical protein